MIRGRTDSGTEKMLRSSSLHAPVSRSRSDVRDALPASMRCSPLRCHSSQESMVPRHSSPARLRAREGSTSSSSHAAFAAENIGSRCSPLILRTAGPWPASQRRAQVSVVRRSCQLSTGDSGVPVASSQTTSDSRWLLIPIATISAESTWARTSSTARAQDSMTAMASCCTQPGIGVCRASGAAPRAMIRPPASTTSAFVDEVP